MMIITTTIPTPIQILIFMSFLQIPKRCKESVTIIVDLNEVRIKAGITHHHCKRREDENRMSVGVALDELDYSPSAFGLD